MLAQRLLLLVLLAAGCFNADPYACHSEASCLDHERQGQCMASGDGVSYCAFQDATCPSGMRWSQFAAASLAQTCVAVTRDAGADLSNQPPIAAFTVSADNVTVDEHQNFKVHIVAVDANNTKVPGYTGQPQLTTDWGDLHIGGTPDFSNGEAYATVSLNRETDGMRMAHIKATDGAASGVSQDLTVKAPAWVVDQMNVFDLGSGWDSAFVGPPSMVRGQNGYYQAWYFGFSQNHTNDGIGHAVSNDGLTWLRESK